MNDLDVLKNSEIFSVLSNDDEKLLDSKKPSPIFNYSYDSCNEFLNKIHLNCEIYKIAVDDCATNLINDVFDNNVDDDTLVVISEMEHPSVSTNAYCSKNLLILSKKDINEFNIEKILDEYKRLNLKKIFLCIIGTNADFGEVISNSFFMRLKNSLRTIPHKMMIDDCQSLGIISRNYDIFDYIIGTAHSIIKKFDMGILIYKQDERRYGKDAYNWMEEYVTKLNCFIPKLKYYSFEFNTKMKDIFSALLATGKVILYDSAPHIFALKIIDTLKIDEKDIKKLSSYNIFVSIPLDKKSFNIRFRISEILIYPDDFYEGLEYLYSILTKEYPYLCFEDYERIECDRY